MAKRTSVLQLKHCIIYAVIVVNESLLEPVNNSIGKVALMFVTNAIKKDLLKHKVPLGSVLINLMPVQATSYD